MEFVSLRKELRRNNYNFWFILILFGSLSPTAFVISVTAASPSAQKNVPFILVSNFLFVFEFGYNFFIRCNRI